MPKNDDIRNVHPGESQIETTVKDTVCNYSKFLQAEDRCHRLVGYKNSVSRAHMLKMSRCYNLYAEMLNGTYRCEFGDEFAIYEPRYRIVTTTRYRDRIPQTSFILNFYYPYIVPQLIDNNFACLKNRGVDDARNTMVKLLREAEETDVCLKVDIHDYFGSIEHTILFEEMYPYIQDEWGMWFYKDVVNSNGKQKGIGLGSEINQLSATTLTNRIDHAILQFTTKYERYMDDFIVIGSRQICENVLYYIKEELAKLHLEVSPKKTYIQSVMKPIKFLGFTFLKHPTGKITMRRMTGKLNNEKRKLRRMKRANVPFNKVIEHRDCIRSLMKKGVRSGVIKYDRYFNNLFKEELDNVRKNSEG